MNHPSLHAAFAAVRHEVSSCSLAILNEEYLETVACLGVLQSGGSFFQAGNVPGKRFWIRMERGRLCSEPVLNTTSQVGTQKRRGRPNGSKSSDLYIRLEDRVYRIEIKTRCSFGSSSSNSSATLFGDVQKLKEGFADALILAADVCVYQNLLGDRLGKRGAKGNEEVKAEFAALFPALDRLNPEMVYEALEPHSRIHVRAHFLQTSWGDRILAVLANEAIEWCSSGVMTAA
jgi:hypothetical protein